MANPNKKVKRPDGLGKLFKYFTSEDEKIMTLPIEKMLKENYIYIHRAIKKENFFIAPEDSCFFFKEILYDNEVVGFATYRPSNINNDSLVMQYIYVLPEYRSIGLLEEELDEASVLFESSILIEYPTKDMVESLIKHRLVRVFDDRFAISRIPFFIPMVPIDDVKSGILREDYKKNEEQYRKLSLIYDLELCAVVGLASDDIENVFTGDLSGEDIDMNNFNVISLPLRVDNEKYDCLNKRENDPILNNGTYFQEVKDLVENNDKVIQNWLTLL